MKKSSTIRLHLNRETLRTLASPELMATPGAMNTLPYCLTVSCRVSCGGTCGVICVAPGTTQTC